jgi:hypothetical protein
MLKSLAGKRKQLLKNMGCPETGAAQQRHGKQALPRSEAVVPLP